MQTPWGSLETLDLESHEFCRKVLASDKHQLIEGLVVESLFDQIFHDVPRFLNGAVPLDVDTAIVRAGSGSTSYFAFVWARKRQTGLGRWLKRLVHAGLRVWLVEHDEPLTTFFAREYVSGALEGSLPLAELMAALSGRRSSQPVVAEAVRDIERQRQSFWGFLSSHYGKELGSRVVLPRLFMNHGVQPWFRSVWNLDRVVVHGDQVWLLEIKHKYSIPGSPLVFGLNDGELRVIEDLSKGGIRCLHAIIVKPVWSKTAGSMYLMNDIRRRGRAALVAVELDPTTTAMMRSEPRRSSGSDTTFTGSGRTAFYPIGAQRFGRLGRLSDDPAELAKGLALMIEGRNLPAVSDAWLRELSEKSA